MGLKIAIGGKGGVGKTTVCAILSELFAKDGLDVLAIDADPDTNLAAAFGLSAGQAPTPLIEMKQLIGQRTGTGKEAVGAYFKLNPEVADLQDKYALKVNGLKLLALGALKSAGSGCACAEGAFLKALLSYTILQKDQVVLVDLDAGVECMGRASIQGIDALVIVVEPGGRSIETANNVTKMARDLGIKNIVIIANKITDAAQLDMINSQLNSTVLAALPYDDAIRDADLYRTKLFDASEKITTELKKVKSRLVEMTGK